MLPVDTGGSGEGEHWNQTTLASPSARDAEEVNSYWDKDVVVPEGYCSITDEFGCEAFENITTITEDNAFESKCAVIPGGHGSTQQDQQTIYRWIRLQARPDQSLGAVRSRKDVFAKIDEIIETQGQYSRADLYSRSWKPAQMDKDRGIMRWVSPIFSNNNKRRNGGNSNNETTVTHSFSVMQFNTLAEGLSCGPTCKTPFPLDPASEKQARQKSNYGGFTRTKHPEVALDFSLRQWRLLEVILGQGYKSIDSNSSEPLVNNDMASDGEEPKLQLFDLIAMEEVDRYRGVFAPALALFGYKAVFVPKPHAPGVRLGWYSDGCALFYQTKTFELVEEHSQVFNVGTQVYSVVLLKHRPSGRFLVVAVTHLKAQKRKVNEQIRTAQITELLQFVEQISNHAASLQQQQDKSRKKPQIPILIMGDLNSDPPSMLPKGCVKRILQNHKSSPLGTRLRSAYPVDPPKPGFFTTWKTRGDDTVKRVIDYIFYSQGGLRCTETLAMPDGNEIEADGCLPGLRYPSDHMSIAAKFELYTE